MSYTHANVQWERYTRLDNNQIVDKYGDIDYTDYVVDSDSIKVTDSNGTFAKCGITQYIIARKQPHSEVVTDENGKTFLTKNIYYVDPSIEPSAFNILKYDKLDGELIINVYEMRTLFDKVRMIKFTTV